MEIVYLIRTADGSPWEGSAETDESVNALRACLKNERIDARTAEFIRWLCEGLPPDISFAKTSNEIKLQCRRRKCRVTVSLRYPCRQITADNLRRMASAYPVLSSHAKNENAGSETPTVKLEVPPPPLARIPLEAMVLAEALLRRRGIQNPSEVSVIALAEYYQRKGCLPPLT